MCFWIQSSISSRTQKALHLGHFNSSEHSTNTGATYAGAVTVSPREVSRACVANPYRSILGSAGAAPEAGLERRDRHPLIHPGHHTTVVAVGTVPINGELGEVEIGKGIGLGLHVPFVSHRSHSAWAAVFPRIARFGPSFRRLELAVVLQQ